MTTRIKWLADTSVPVTSFVLTRSTDSGASYSALATISFNINGANYDKATRSFFYDDGAGTAGNVYKIVAVGPSGSSAPVYIVAPPAELSFCNIIGYARDPFGAVDVAMEIIVEAYGTRGEKWVQGPTGLIGRASMGLGLTQGSRTVYPDANGIWQVSLIQKAVARIHIPDLDFSLAFEVPGVSGPINVRDIPQLRGSALEQFPDYDGTRDTLTVG